MTAPEAPRTINKEWQEASNQRALDQKMNPITGPYTLRLIGWLSNSHSRYLFGRLQGQGLRSITEIEYHHPLFNFQGISTLAASNVVSELAISLTPFIRRTPHLRMLAVSLLLILTWVCL